MYYYFIIPKFDFLYYNINTTGIYIFILVNMAEIEEYAGIDMSPAEISQVSVNIFQDSDNPNVKALNRYMADNGQRLPTGDKTFNINDQHFNAIWKVADDKMPQLFNICEKIRKDGAPYGLSLRQTEGSKIWFDMDVKLGSSDHFSEDSSLWRTIATKFATSIVEDGVYQDDEEHSVYILVTNRTRTTSDSGGLWKDGLHIYTSVSTSISHRHFITSKVIKPEFVKSLFSRKQIAKIKNIDNVVDRGACTVNPMLLGATKRTGVLYKVAGLFKCDFFGRDFDDINIIDHSKLNLTAIFNCTSYIPAESSHMLTTIKLRPSVENSLKELNQNIYNDEEQDEDEDDAIDIITMNDPRGRELSDMIDLLSRSRSDDYNSWRKILFALAQYKDKYKVIAKKFSRRWPNFDENKFEEDWARILAGCHEHKSCSIAMIKNMAKTDDPIEFAKMNDKTIIRHTIRIIFEIIKFQNPKSARIKHFQIADIIATAFPNKYIATPKSSASGHKLADDSDVNYWVYSTKDSDTYIEGNACKYVAIQSLAPLNVWISRIFPKVLETVRKWLFEQRDKPDNTPESSAKFSVGLAMIGKAHSDIMCDSFKSSVVRQFAMISTKFGFVEKLDKDPYVMGVYDGLLETGLRPKLVKGLSEHKVSKSAKGIYLPYNPTNPMIIKVFQILLDFVPIHHFDVILWILLFQSQVMVDTKKDLFMLNLWGYGANGKSVLIEGLNNALGEFDSNGYAYKFNISVLTEKEKSSSNARSDIMPMYKTRYLSASESNKCSAILPENLKKILAGESTSARELYGQQKTGFINAVMVIGTNDALEFNLINGRRRAYDLDYGSTRRLKVYRAMMKYVDDPDPENEYERKKDGTIIKNLINDKKYQGALLSVLSIANALFTMIHKENMSSVISPNIEKQTDKHMSRMDITAQFIRESCVYTDESYKMTLNSVIDEFITWYNGENVIHDRNHIGSALIRSRLLKNKIVQENNNYFVHGVRTISKGEELRDGEQVIEDKSKWQFKHYTDFKLNDGTNLPFDGKIKPTTDAREFAKQLGDLYNHYIVEHDNNN